ncbi:HAD hydrolase-like protein [Streptomyces sp. DSM 42041]|uniref:HAD hydrolase-like protein n=1 Tax=Streptomyces hazeniae TaxID=3075538 RepID=A0ABU2NZX9_9ACTN|nr:HAD family hydrolase [Streptomyces sp. DSM 42041]MDT0381183.1 HAD hydrolase-like protein [Streptomyces sp. DSM 42041]
MTVRGVLFDFSGTLLRVEPAVRWLAAVLAGSGVELPRAEAAGYAARLERAGALPGGAPPRAVPPHLDRLWWERDCSAEQHRAAYTGLARQVPLPREDLYDALYDRHMTPEAWEPYPDAFEVLGALRDRAVPVAVVSNIGWDLRPVFRGHALDGFVQEYVLSFEHGVQKPDPRLFRTACAALRLEPEEVLMVGDDRRADGGATAVGCAYHPVDHLPVEQRPHGLRPLLDLLGPA